MGKLQTRLNGIARRLAELDALRSDAADYPPASLPVRYYELDANGQRIYVEPGEGELELERKCWRLVHGDQRPPHEVT